MTVARPQTGNFLILPQETILCPTCVPESNALEDSVVRKLHGYSRCERCGEGKKTAVMPPLPD